MSGHSKWHNIQARKGKADAIRANAFAKAVKAITIAAKNGGGDSAVNFALRFAIDKAREVNLPKDKIKRAIDIGTGAAKTDSVIEEVLYEGFGPAGAAVLIAAATDNKNRTSGEIRRIFSDFGGSVGGAGSVSWMFENVGVVRISGADAFNEEFELALIDAGAKDIIKSKDGAEIITDRASLSKVVQVLSQRGIGGFVAGLEWVPKEKMAIDESAKSQLENFFETLLDSEDVQDFYTNAAL